MKKFLAMLAMVTLSGAAIAQSATGSEASGGAAGGQVEPRGARVVDVWRHRERHLLEDLARLVPDLAEAAHP